MNIQGNLFLTSDLHLDHEGIRIHCERPFSTNEEMNDAIVRGWNALVKARDTVVILGDLAWKNHAHWIHALNGHKIMVFGNHDRMPLHVQQSFTEIVGTPRSPGILEFAVGGQKVVGCHYPMASWNGSRHGAWHFYGHCHARKVERMEAGAEPPTPPELEGCDAVCDVMTRIPEFYAALSAAVDMDAWDFMPVPFEVLQVKMRERLARWEARKALFDDWLKTIPAGGDYSARLAAVNRKYRAGT